jgi:hypothetical protein
VCFADAELVSGDIGVSRHALDGFAARVLAEGDDGWVVDDGEGFGAHFAEVVAEKERRLQCGPHGEVCFVLDGCQYRLDSATAVDIAYLLVSHATETHFEHVQVIPAARQATINVWRDFVDNRENRTVSAWSDAVRICGITACAEVIGPSEGVVDVSRNAP